jgi:uncharacterized protein
MPKVTHPGVFVEEVPSGVRAIEGVSTSTAGFVGGARSETGDGAVRLSSWREFVRTFGDPAAKPSRGGGHLAAAVRGFFDNGGSRCWVAAELGELETIDELSIVCAPDLPGDRRDDLIAHCESAGDRVAILDPPPGLGPADVLKWREAQGDSRFAALYYPWVEVAHPAGGKSATVPPCGHVAGVWARTDAARGVHRAPANEKLNGVTGLAHTVTQPDHERLNPRGVNCIRSFPGRGILVWGARTLAAAAEAEWKYVNVCRTALYIEESLGKGTQWAAFEPNNPALWAQLRLAAGNFMNGLWRSGAFAGSKPEQAYLVKCDATTTSQRDIEDGRVNILVGFAPLRPAEFVIVRIAQTTLAR